MVPIAPHESTEPAGLEPGPGGDRLRRVVHVALAIYLLPVVAIVCAIGGASIVLGGATRVASRLASGGRGGEPARSPFLGPTRSRPAGAARRARGRARAHR